MRIKKNLDEIIVAKMNSEIVEGKWEPGEHLSLERFMDEYGVSRTPVIHALKKLTAMGVVQFTNAGHYKVPEHTEKQVKDICSMRLMLENRALEDIANKSDKPNLEQLKEICNQSIDANNNGEMIQARLADLEFHRRLVDLAENECLSELFRRVQSKFMVANYLLTNPSVEAERYACEDHAEILRDLENGDLVQAKRILRSHIEGACAKILDKMSSAA